MALSLYQLEPLLREGITTINNVRSLDFKALTLKDVVTLVGLVYTAGKGVAMAVVESCSTTWSLEGDETQLKTEVW